MRGKKKVKYLGVAVILFCLCVLQSKDVKAATDVVVEGDGSVYEEEVAEFPFEIKNSSELSLVFSGDYTFGDFTVNVVGTDGTVYYSKSDSNCLEDITYKLPTLMKGSYKLQIISNDIFSFDYDFKLLAKRVGTIEDPIYSFAFKSKSLYIGSSITQTVSSNPAIKVTGVTWSSSNPKIAMVDSKGKITAKAAGKATISAKVNNSTLTCTITVLKPSLNAKGVSLYRGKSKTLSVKGGSGKIVWKSSNSSVVIVSQKGVITAKKKGTATITAKRNGVSLSCKVTVLNPKLDKTKITLYPGEKQKLIVIGRNGGIKCKTSNKNVATVSADGTILAKKKGTATITVVNQGVKMSCVVTVKAPALNKKSLTLKVGDSQTITLKGATNKVTWKSSNTKIATVNSKGKIVGKKAGTVKITATHNKTKYTCMVKVNAKPVIKIKNVDWEINFLGGIEPIITFQNLSSKTIKYIDFETSYYNRFGDPAYCDITGSNKRTLQVTGPIKAGETYTAYWDAVLYNGGISRVDINKIVITYTDGSKKTVKYNRYWYDSNYYYK